ncbi:RHS repeat-associated core domain-containing protein, partial [Flavobacterium sp. LS1R47]
GLKDLKGDRSFIPFRQLGQYEDVETELYYNRYRYYSPDAGVYLSQDRIGLAGNNPNFYAYVKDSNSWLDILGLNPIIANPNDINFSQRTVSDVRVWNPEKYTKPIDVMVRDGQMVSYDNRRLLSAQNANLSELKVNMVDGNDIMPGSNKTWNEAFEKRFKDIRNIREGGVVPNNGLKDKPKLPSCH